ncbi:hypothetical protein DF182_22430 [Chitinophaga flava]|uniref:Uncharacterized protein n=1 Tax=Chitinophaga flava TaxID=2259036 RepID=A0A365XTD9_9BACT|nr:hypothetical protein DF182_22430 [Chitinophaga flava]
MKKPILNTILTSIVEIVLFFFLYRVFYNYFPFHRPAGRFMIAGGDYYLILPVSYIIGSFVLNFIYFKSDQSRSRLILYALTFAILTMIIFTAVCVYQFSPSFYFMFTFEMGIYFFCWLLLGAIIQSVGFNLMSKAIKKGKNKGISTL